MKTVTISKLKASFSRYLYIVRRGQEVLITVSGRPVARLSPVEELGLRERLVREGIISPLRRPRAPLKTRLAKGPPAGVLAALLQEREEGR